MGQERWQPAHAEDNGELQTPFVLKWYQALGSLSRFLQLRTADPAFQLPLVLDEDESKICRPPSTPSSTLLIGRSGTGKTSIAQHLLYEACCRKERRSGDGAENVVFLCKSRTLCSQVSRNLAELAAPIGLDIPTSDVLGNSGHS